MEVQFTQVLYKFEVLVLEYFNSLLLYPSNETFGTVNTVLFTPIHLMNKISCE